MSVVQQCPRCEEVWRYESAPDRELVSVYCLCASLADARRGRATEHTPSRMLVLDAAPKELATAAA